MSNDRDARGLEQTVQLLDRALFCRSFHSKLSPVGGLRREARTAGLHPSSRPLTGPQKTQSLSTTVGQNEIETPALPSLDRRARDVEVRTKSPGVAGDPQHRSEIWSSPVCTGLAIKPLKNLRLSKAPVVLDRIGTRRSNQPVPTRFRGKRRLSLPFRAIHTECPERKSLLFVLFRNASTDVPAIASTSGSAVFNGSFPSCQEQICANFDLVPPI